MSKEQKNGLVILVILLVLAIPLFLWNWTKDCLFHWEITQQCASDSWSGAVQSAKDDFTNSFSGTTKKIQDDLIKNSSGTTLKK